MKTIPLFYYPTTTIWVDDDRNTLNSMTLVFGNQGHILPFQSANKCLEFLGQYKPPLLGQSFLQSVTEDENYGVLKYTPINVDVTQISELANLKDKHNEVTVMVIDYHMPEMDGFSLAKSISHLPIQKILLTGKAQDNDVINGFNNNLIHRFVQKAEDNQFGKLSLYLKELSIQYFENLTHPLLSTLEAESPLPLSDPIFIEFFTEYCEENKVSEFYLIDKNGSFLCIDYDGNKSCLIMQSDKGLDSWISENMEEKLLSSNDIKLVKERKIIPFFGIGKELWQVDTDNISQYFYTPRTLNGRDRYFWVKMDQVNNFNI